MTQRYRTRHELVGEGEVQQLLLILICATLLPVDIGQLRDGLCVSLWWTLAYALLMNMYKLSKCSDDYWYVIWLYIIGNILQCHLMLGFDL